MKKRTDHNIFKERFFGTKKHDIPTQNSISNHYHVETTIRMKFCGAQNIAKYDIARKALHRLTIRVIYIFLLDSQYWLEKFNFGNNIYKKIILWVVEIFD